MRYGIDIDGVIANFKKGFNHAMNFAPEKLRLSQRYDLDGPWKAYDHCKTVVGPTNWRWFWNDAIALLRVYETLYPLRDEVLHLNELGKNNPIYLITSRGLEFQQTLRWCANQELRINGVIDSGKPELKRGFINALGLDVYVDDSPTTMVNLVGNTEAQLFLFDSDWNKDITTPKLTRIRSLKELL